MRLARGLVRGRARAAANRRPHCAANWHACRRCPPLSRGYIAAKVKVYPSRSRCGDRVRGRDAAAAVTSWPADRCARAA
ncbi:hypothetical protein EVAR_56926_1 [Eumeta japonica]|uniref:Uncharacterized protein n=1 Tax=Eumeta variegata TaxID=151549 RepID=A0A4C1YBS3_EUMVA|nr:hypothetical protein EVAR_56926_1 [Eumeta japonica]